jgi:hypothetical protein
MGDAPVEVAESPTSTSTPSSSGLLGSYFEFKAWQSTFRRGFHKESGSVEALLDEAAAAEAVAAAADEDDEEDCPAVVETRASDFAVFFLARKNQTRLAEAELSSMNSQRGMIFEREQAKRSKGGRAGKRLAVVLMIDQGRWSSSSSMVKNSVYVSRVERVIQFFTF